jgi:group I intron endonuclease
MQLKINQYDTVETGLAVEIKKEKIIYLITNTVNGKKYIGKTEETLLRRKKRHIYCANHGGKNILYRAMRKHGLDNFVFEIIYVCGDEENINQKEIYFIDFLNTKIPNGYNMTNGGEGITGLKRTLEHRKNLSRALAGRKILQSTRQKISTALTGRKLSIEHLQNIKQSHSTVTFKEKIRNANLGRKLPPEQIEKIRLSNIGRPYCGKPHSEETRKKIGDSSRARKRTEEWKKRISNSNKGKKMSEDAKQKMRLAKLGKPSLKKGKTYTNQNQLGGVN